MCPNRGGGFVARPIRPKTERRLGVGFMHDPVSTRRVYTKYTNDEISEFCNAVKDISPEER